MPGGAPLGTYEWRVIALGPCGSGRERGLEKRTGSNRPGQIEGSPTRTAPGAVRSTASGGAGGGFVVSGTSFTVTLSAAIPPGPYQIRVIGLSPTDQPVGAFSDAVTVVVE